MDISKCFRGSLQLRDNESRLYLHLISFFYVSIEAYVGGKVDTKVSSGGNSFKSLIMHGVG